MGDITIDSIVVSIIENAINNYTNKLNIVAEMNKFLETQNLTRSSYEETKKI